MERIVKRLFVIFCLLASSFYTEILSGSLDNLKRLPHLRELHVSTISLEKPKDNLYFVKCKIHFT